MYKENEHYFVCNYHEPLFSNFVGKAFVVKTNDLHMVNKINDVVNHHNKLHCLQLNVDGKLAATEIKEEWADIPMHLFVPEFGSFKDVIHKVGLLRKLNIRIFLNSDFVENFTNLQILASLGIDCGICFGKRNIDWELMNDLMHYAIYGKARRATIEPFHYLVTRYNPQQYIDLGTVYFENHQRYMHISSDGKFALTAVDLESENFLNLDETSNICNNQKYLEKESSWNTLFLKQDGCAYCPGYRICLGKFADSIDEKKSCSVFFEDMLDACDFFASKNNNVKTKELCQL